MKKQEMQRYDALINHGIIGKILNFCSDKYKCALFVWIVSLIAIFPVFTTSISWGLDDSWRYLINKAAELKLVFGRDIFFTYGPLGYLLVPLNIGGNRIVSAVFLFCLFLCNAKTLHYFIVKKESSVEGAIIAFFIFAVNGFKDIYSYVIFSMILLALRVLEIEKSYQLFFLLCVFAAFCWMLKFDIAIMGTAVVICVSSCVVLGRLVIHASNKHGLMHNEGRTILSSDQTHILPYLMLPFSVPVLFMAEYYIYNPSLRDMKSYLKNGFLIAAGYNAAMTLEDDGFWIHIVWGGILFFILFCSMVLLKSENVYRILICAVFLLFAYKYAMVRSDIVHVVRWDEIKGYVTAGLLLSMDLNVYEAVFPESKFGKSMKYVMIFVLLLMGAAFLVWHYVAIIGLGMIKRKRDDVRKVLKIMIVVVIGSVALITMESHIVGINNIIKDDSVSAAATLPEEILNMIEDETMTVYPHDILWTANSELNYVPYPVFQAYSAYLPELDAQNAAFFRGDEAPEYIIFARKAIDERYMFWENPKTAIAIEQNYESAGKYVVLNNATIYVLKRRTVPIEFETIDIDNVTQKVTDLITIPETSNEVLINLHLKPKGIKRIIQMVYCINPIYAEIQYDDGTSKKVRILTDQLEDSDLMTQGEIFEETDRKIKSILLNDEKMRYFHPDLQIEITKYRRNIAD